ncbi:MULTISPECIES: hypothetical protein [Aminobacterium]|uniref:hypothetical protein n=1 Tax=Aminobacterium TaxID=81466 RepID=UPI00257FAF3E|nr:hypothetical protein [Aminobacterium sp. UBA4834]
MKRRCTLFCLVFWGVFCLVSPSWGLEPLARATDILEKWTVSHWGRDCLVWIVHYPEELVEPWVDAESTRAALSPGERDAYKKAFMEQLRIGESEPFLITFYSFGARSLSLSPFSENVSLVLRDGSRVKPTSYERKFDEPISGVVQGLVFFPYQNASSFSVAIKGLGIEDEKMFNFAGASSNDRQQEVATVPGQSNRKKDQIVLDLPPIEESSKEKEVLEREKTKAKRAEKQENESAFVEASEAEMPVPLPPVAPAVPPTAKVDLSGLKPISVPEKGDEREESQKATASTPSDKESREEVLERFLSYWKRGDYDAMYTFLSPSSKKLWGQKAFQEDVEKANMRVPLNESYVVEWEGNRARVSAVQKMLFVRTLRKVTIKMVEEDHGWHVQW